LFLSLRRTLSNRIYGKNTNITTAYTQITGKASTMPAIFSQPKCRQTPTAKSSTPTRPGSQHLSMMCEIANGASRMFLAFSLIGIRPPIHVEVQIPDSTFESKSHAPHHAVLMRFGEHGVWHVEV